MLNNYHVFTLGFSVRALIDPSQTFSLSLENMAGHMEAVHSHRWSLLALHFFASQSLILGLLIECYQ